MPKAPALDFVGATETTIDVEFKALSDGSVTDYELQWKEYPAKWDTADMYTKAVKVAGGKKKKCAAQATDLNPGSTYCVRLAGAGMEPGPEIIIDTEQVGCTPKSSGKCTVM